MDRGLYVAMTGAKQIMQAQAVNNHNIANSSTTGYRADGVASTSEPIYGPGYATRVNAVAGDAGTDFSSGVMMSTGSPLDIAVNGKGFISVRGADGKEAYTRAGDLQVTALGAVMTSTGFPVLSESGPLRSEEHTSELQSHVNLVCRLLLEKKKKKICDSQCHKKKIRLVGEPR